MLFILNVALGSCGQFFVHKILNEYGSLSISIVGSCRKFISILLSIVLFAHPVYWYQMFAILMIMGCVVQELREKKAKIKA